jgi:hypothetical protein
MRSPSKREDALLKLLFLQHINTSDMSKRLWDSVPVICIHSIWTQREERAVNYVSSL